MDLLKNISGINQSAATIDVALLVLRITIGILMLNHGIPKVKKLLSSEPIQFFSTFGLSEKNSLIAAAFVEVFFSFLLIVGLGTRLAAIPLLLTMVIAAFHTLKAFPFDKKEVPILFLLIYIALLLGGSGKFSLDYIIFGLK
ncbi:DoxX family protein [Draconibacterium sp. IB214405]|uniref:DoxX family protein n=1 Tax=Draconibacterium sp. IB214405 TaxID=3097352 RepID=UPI002A0C3E2C|nr:DoxX family protein [Draconibacterium sp. IB214405]MDX8339868.1 DoxX family protein [Draconibacterium sp. IB214405]